MKKRTSPPFPQALHGKKGIKNASEILEVLRQVKVNIPLLDMIKQVPSYAKFLKDLCTIKRGLNVNKKAFLTEQVSAIIQCKSPLKYKDPGCPTISVMIGGKVVEKALLDLGASVNLLPYSVYKQLGLGELKPTSITLSLADRSVKIPRGIIEDVLVQVDNFYYPVDFVVLDTDPLVKEANYVPIILGRPFLATSNAIINCRNGLMQLTFGNMTLELNIFHMSKKLITPEEEEGPEEVLERVSGHPFYCFLDGYSGYFQIEIDVEDQEKTTFTCPFGTYAYRRMSLVYAMHLEHSKDQFLTTAPIVRVPNWQLPFEVMCDASDFAIGVVLGQREDGKPYVIYYASKTLNEAQRNYTTTEKELLAMVFALDKFRAYLVGSFIIVFTDHSALKDKKGVENVVADHLSRLAIAHNSHVLPINDDFPEESLMLLEKAPWYAHIANYLVTGEVPNQIIRKCVPEEEQQGILSHCYENGLWRPLCLSENSHEGLAIKVYLAIAFQRFHIMCRSCDRCQRLGKLTKETKMPMNPILIVDLLVVLKFLKENILSRFGVPKAIINDRDLNEMEELRNDAYINSKVAKQRMKKWHDQLISNKELRKEQIVLLYDSRLHIFPGKIKSSSSELSQAPPFVDQLMPPQEPPTGEAAEPSFPQHHSTSLRSFLITKAIEIEESSLESIRCLDRASGHTIGGRRIWVVAGCWNDVARLAHIRNPNRGARHVSSWGIRMELLRIATHGIAYSTRENSIRPTFHFLRIFHIRNSIRRHFTSGYLTAGWKRRTFQLPRSDTSGSSDSAYLESFFSQYIMPQVSPKAS
ncbi:Retrovirus-related Pol polyprotein from transposon opus [Vitis vinifera]|uniref:RNA-directed DNA polymerase n=1 Tax=Vitis vinifera TaxID=29760 RepID=A0A438C901_VITVI|nr:Retrovirus-related Pol polyprotein from transposon opus [Vitis vinifera]